MPDLTLGDSEALTPVVCSIATHAPTRPGDDLKIEVQTETKRDLRLAVPPTMRAGRRLAADGDEAVRGGLPQVLNPTRRTRLEHSGVESGPPALEGFL